MNIATVTIDGVVLYTEPATEKDFAEFERYEVADYSSLKRVRNWDKQGRTFLYMAKYSPAYLKPHDHEWHVWYPVTKAQWISFGATQLLALAGAMRDGWKYA